MIKFAIWAPHWEPNSGGLIALFKLAHNLTALGEKTYLISPNKNNEWLGELAGPEIIDDNTFVIYPEIICGNPFNAKNVVRWILNTPGAVGGDGIYADTDMVYKYANYFGAPDESKVIGELRAFDLQLNFWMNFNRPRNGEAYLVRKGHYKSQDKHQPGSQRIDGYDNYNMREVFNNKEIFISYDSECFTSVLAALCGCTSVVIPKDGISGADWKNKFPYFKFGVAYGLGDIQWAVDTKHLVKEHLASLEVESLELTKQFIRDCKERINL